VLRARRPFTGPTLKTWFHEEDGRGRRRSAIYLTHLLILGLLKHLVFFSVDTIEKEEFEIEKVENNKPANMRSVIFFQLKEYTLGLIFQFL